MDGPLVLAIDQGSSATKALLLDRNAEVISRSRVPVRESHPRAGWVEQDATEIRVSVRAAAAQCLAGQDASALAAVGIASQRESMLLWERATGRPVGPLVSWQDTRTAALCQELGMGPLARQVPRISGLPLDPMFSAPKARWLLDRYDPDRSRSARGELCLGTVDSWLLSRGEDHVIEIGNAARTQLLDLDAGTWSQGLLEGFGVPAAALPSVAASDGPFPAACGLGPVPDGTPVLAVMGDSHAALFGHGIRQPGAVKATYGTGSSVMGLSGPGSVGGAGVCRTITWQLRGDLPCYALEGNIRAAGATLAWLARLLGATTTELAALAADSPSDGVHIVPGFNGLAAPWWDRDATGLITGLSLGAGPAQLARAAVESVAFQVADVVAAIAAAGAEVGRLLADGGASVNDTLMQLQADLIGVAVHRSAAPDISALGAAHLAGLVAGIWDEEQLARLGETRDVFEPRVSAGHRQDRLRAWHDAVRRAQGNVAASQSPRTPN